MASDHKWYPPELHPDAFHTAPTEELPVTPGELPPPPPQHLFERFVGRTSGDPSGSTSGPPHEPSTQQLPVPPEPVPPGPTAHDMQPGSDRSKTAVVITVLVILVVALAGGLIASLFALRSSSADDAMPPTPVDTTTPTTTTTATTTRPTTSDVPGTSIPDISTIIEPTTTLPAPTTTLIPLPTQPTTDDRNPRMPDVICLDLPEARRSVAAAGAGSVRTFDATGAGRRQIIHENWIVVSQDPSADSAIAGRQVSLGVVKNGETSDC